MSMGPQSPMDRISARATRYELAREDAVARGWKVPPEGSPLAAPDWHEAWINYWHACERHAADPSSGRPVQPHRSGGGEYVKGVERG